MRFALANSRNRWSIKQYIWIRIELPSANILRQIVHNLTASATFCNICPQIPRRRWGDGERGRGVSEKKSGARSKQTRRHGDAETRRIQIPTKISLTRGGN
ncbi:MAG: hypothetical protein F6K58_13195 [Symploca sp. SIO2E9]|nr:hypothetical protein [Symploca sp. SIO2E9]